MNKEYLIEQLINIANRHNLGLEASTIEEIVMISSFRMIKKGEIFGHIGDRTVNVGLVLSGIARSYYIDGDGNDITRGFSIAGTLCMDEGMFGYTENICEWEALEDSMIMFFGVEKLKEMVYTYDDLKTAYILLLENALQYKIYRENGFLIENATERYIHFRKLYPEICNKVAQHYIATYLGIAPESLSRIRKAMRENE